MSEPLDKNSTCEHSDIQSYDIVIVGGGLAGTTMATALLSALAPQILSSKSHLSIAEHTDLKIAIIEAFPINDVNKVAASHSSFDGKAIALSYGSAQKLNEWQIWPHLKSVCQPIQKIEVSEQGSAGFSFLNKPQNQNALGFVVEAAQFGYALNQTLSALTQATSDRLTWYCPDTLVAIQYQDTHNQLTLKSGQRINAKLVLACDGGNSQVRQLISPDFVSEDYTQVALTANVEIDRDHSGIAYERFTKNGPLAMLPMVKANTNTYVAEQTNNRFGLVWCGHSEKAQQLLTCSEATFIQQLQAEFGFKAGKVTQVGKRQTYPLKRSWLTQNYTQGVVFIANASHTVHPIAGQGFNLGLRDITAALNTIEYALENKLDIGHFQVWNHYLTQRQSDIEFILTATDSLVRGFSNHYPLLRLPRNIGLIGLELSPTLKQKFAQKAMGLF